MKIILNHIDMKKWKSVRFEHFKKPDTFLIIGGNFRCKVNIDQVLLTGTYFKKYEVTFCSSNGIYAYGKNAFKHKRV